MNDQGVFKSTTARDPLIRFVNYSAMYCIEKIVDAGLRCEGSTYLR